jgi:hypothetical protein
MTLLALATLSLERPGFTWALREIANKIDNPSSPYERNPQSMFESFRKCNADKWEPEPERFKRKPNRSLELIPSKI